MVKTHRHIWVVVVVAMAAWYATATTGGNLLILDGFTRTAKTVAIADFPCAAHACGCRTAEQCAERCCCFPKEPEPMPGCPMHESVAQATAQPVTTEVLAICVATCSGGTHDGNIANVPTVQPHEIPRAPVCSASMESARWTISHSFFVPSHHLDVPEHIPISISRAIA